MDLVILEPDNTKTVRIRYANYKAEISERTILPLWIWHGVSPWHKGLQWFLQVYDLDKKAERSLAIKDILDWDIEE